MFHRLEAGFEDGLDAGLGADVVVPWGFPVVLLEPVLELPCPEPPVFVFCEDEEGLYERYG